MEGAPQDRTGSSSARGVSGFPAVSSDRPSKAAPPSSVTCTGPTRPTAWPSATQTVPATVGERQNSKPGGDTRNAGAVLGVLEVEAAVGAKA